MLEQLSRPRFFPAFEISRPFSTCLARRKKWEISKPGKNRGLESFSNILFPLQKNIVHIRHKKPSLVYISVRSNESKVI